MEKYKVDRKTFHSAVQGCVNILPFPSRSIIRYCQRQLKTDKDVRHRELEIILDLNQQQTLVATGEAFKAFHRLCSENPTIRAWAKQQGRDVTKLAIVEWLFGKED